MATPRHAWQRPRPPRHVLQRPGHVLQRPGHALQRPRHAWQRHRPPRHAFSEGPRSPTSKKTPPTCCLISCEAKGVVYHQASIYETWWYTTNSFGLSSLTHSLQIHCIGLIGPRPHIIWA